MPHFNSQTNLGYICGGGFIVRPNTKMPYEPYMVGRIMQAGSPGIVPRCMMRFTDHKLIRPLYINKFLEY